MLRSAHLALSPIRFSAQLILPFQIDIRTVKFILRRLVRRHGLISALVTISSPRLKARAWCGNLCGDEPMSPSQLCRLHIFSFILNLLDLTFVIIIINRIIYMAHIYPACGCSGCLTSYYPWSLDVPYQLTGEHTTLQPFDASIVVFFHVKQWIRFAQRAGVNIHVTHVCYFTCILRIDRHKIIVVNWRGVNWPHELLH